MSLHAQLSPEAEARLAAQRRNSTISSAIIAFLAIVIVGMTLGLVFLPSVIKDVPTIVSYKSNQMEEQDQEQKKVSTSIQRKPTSPASSSVRVIASTSSSPVSIPVPDVVEKVESVEFGDGEDFGGGWGEGIGVGAGGGASFFNQQVKAERIAYVIDFSISMQQGGREKLMRKELAKSVKGLSVGTKYQLIFFSGPGWVAGDEVIPEGTAGRAVVKARDGGTYDWTSKSLWEWKSRGKTQEPMWIDTSEDAISESLSLIKSTKLVGGTDWETPLEMAIAMDPPPQIIFFMTDGDMKQRDMMRLARGISAKAKTKDIVINTIAMMEPLAEEAMGEIAKRTGGQFTIVDKDGKSRVVPVE